ncbi:MAG: hypothetical protein JXA82_09760 [Sedimentisphaerales bacterium]|nr:hypothetical protein [Sedimentisphaerales bacterium]
MRKVAAMTPARTIIFCILMGPAVSAFAAVKPEHTVTEVICVTNPANLVVRIPDWPGVGPVRARVQIRGIKPREGIDVNVAATRIAERLSKAQSIRLSKIEERSYFRVIADVEVDGINLASELVARQYATTTEPEEPEPVLIQAPNTQIAEPQRLSPVFTRSVLTKGNSDATPVKSVNLYELLDTRVDLSAWNPDMEFETALDILRNSTNPPIPMVVLWGDLNNNALVDKTTPIGLSGVAQIPVRRAIRLLLVSVDGGQDNIDCLARDGVVTIASAASGLRNEMVTRVYETGALTLPMANMLQGMGMGQFGGMGGMGMGMGGYPGMGMGGMGMGGYPGMGMGMGMGNMMSNPYGSGMNNFMQPNYQRSMRPQRR